MEKVDENGDTYMAPATVVRELVINFTPSGGTATYSRNRIGAWDEDFTATSDSEQCVTGHLSWDELVSMMREFIDSEGARPSRPNWRDDPVHWPE